MPIRQRFLLLTALGFAGGLAFVPSILAGANPRPRTPQLIGFVIAVTIVCAFCAWFGLRFADATNLPMPYLRRLDFPAAPSARENFLLSILFGVLFAIAAIAVLRAFHQPNLPGPLWSRVASVLFAAGSLEIVVHLFVMSTVVQIARGRRWPGILVAAVAFTFFHVAGLGGQSAALIVASTALNGVFGLGLGILYARYGFESVLLCHAVGHILAVTLA